LIKGHVVEAHQVGVNGDAKVKKAVIGQAAGERRRGVGRKGL
jgi:hypothetical protein